MTIHRVIKSLSVFACCFLIIVVSVTISTIRVAAEEPKIDLFKLEQELEKKSYSSSGITEVWWMPEEYWGVGFSVDPMMQMLYGKQTLAMLRPYHIFSVSQSTQTSSALTYYTRTALQNNIQLIDKDGNSYSPYTVDEINAVLESQLTQMKQSFAKAVGVNNDVLHFFLFPSHDAQGKRIADPTKKGSFSLLVGYKKFEWQLPLPELIPKKKCPVDGKLLNGTWKYCPFHGAEFQSLTN